MKPSENAHPLFATTLDFVGALSDRPARVEVRIASREGMPLLCLAEAALVQAAGKSPALELVWLSDAPPAGRDVLQLRAFGADRALLAEARHEFTS